MISKLFIPGILILVFIFFPNTTLATYRSKRISPKNFTHIAYPKVNQDRVVWQQPQKNTNTVNIYSYNFKTQKTIKITNSSKDERNPQIYGNNIVWTDNRNDINSNLYDTDDDIYTYNIKTKKTRRITTDPSTQYDPHIYGNVVVWADMRQGMDIYMYDLKTQKEAAVTDGAPWRTSPAVWGKYIYYLEQDDSVGYPKKYSRVWIYNYKTGNRQLITTNANPKFGLVAQGNRIMWYEDTDPSSYMRNINVFVANVQTHKIDKVLTISDLVDWPDLYGNYIIWSDHSQGGCGNPGDVFIYNFVKHRISRVTNKAGSQHNAAMYGHHLVWVDDQADSRLYAAYIK